MTLVFYGSLTFFFKSSCFFEQGLLLFNFKQEKETAQRAQVLLRASTEHVWDCVTSHHLAQFGI